MRRFPFLRMTSSKVVFLKIPSTSTVLPTQGDMSKVYPEETEVLVGNIDIDTSAEPPKKKGFSLMSLQLTSIKWREWIQSQRDSVQPWAQFFSTSNFKIPKNIAPVGRRVVKNIERFQSNYLFIFLGLVIFCILTSPMLLIAIAACLGACYIISLKNQESKLKVMGRELSLAQQYTAVGIISFPLFWVAGAGTAVFWIIGASFFVIMLHASLYKIEEDTEPFELDMEPV